MLKVFTTSSKLQHQPPVALFEKFFTALVDRSLWQVAPDNLKRFLEFGACFRLLFKLTVSLQHCTLYVTVHWVYIQRT